MLWIKVHDETAIPLGLPSDLTKYNDNNTKVINTLKNYIKIGSFGSGKYKAFFRNLYLAGALLVMDVDLATKE